MKALETLGECSRDIGFQRMQWNALAPETVPGGWSARIAAAEQTVDAKFKLSVRSNLLLAVQHDGV